VPKLRRVNTKVMTSGGAVTELLLEYVIVAIGLIASLCLFVSVKREMRHSLLRMRDRIEGIETQLAARPASDQAHPSVFMPAAPRSGFNLNHRTQALRMLRRGETPAHIAAALGVSQQEIELLVRVQKLATSRRPAAGPAAIEGLEPVIGGK
jgi:hypothetical protein